MDKNAKKNCSHCRPFDVLTPRSERDGEFILLDVEFGTMEVKEWSYIFLLLLILELIAVVHSDGLNLEKWFPRGSLHRMHVLQRRDMILSGKAISQLSKHRGITLVQQSV